MLLNLLIYKEKIKQFYNKNGYYTNLGLRFILTLVSLIVISANIGFNSIISNLIVVIIISLISAFLPLNIDLLIIIIVMLIQLYSLSSEIAIAAFLILFVMYLIYFRYTLKDCLIVILLPILFFLKIPYVIPLMLGLVGTPVAIIPVTFGTIIYFILSYAGENSTLITNMSSGSGITKMTMVFNSVLSNKMFLLTFFTFCIVILVVYIIRRRSIDFAPVIAVIIGGVSNIVIMLVGYLVLDLAGILSVGIMIIGSIISIAVAYILQIVILSIDYSRTEYTQFEDDEYYYYVKAVPKINLSAPEVNVKRINIQRTKKKNK